MNRITLFAFAALMLAACTKTIKQDSEKVTETLAFAAKAKQSARSQDIVFNVQNLFPEGVVYDKFNDRFFVSSTTRGDIGIVTRDGVYTPFITDPALTSTTGLEINNARKLLYVSNASNGSVGIYDSNTGTRVNLIDLKLLLPGVPVFINDIALDPQGNAYVTNSAFPVIYKILRDGTASIFYQDPALAITGFGFNGIEYANSGYLLVAYTSANQVLRFPVDNPSAYSMVEFNAPLSNPDGLLLSNNGKELVVVNNAGGSGAGRVSSFTSNNRWLSASVTNSFTTGAVFPTTATNDGKKVYVLYAYLNRRGTGQTEYTIKEISGTGNF